jgi:HK97 family phage major capsid protein
MGVYEAQLIQPGDVSSIEATAVLDEVLGLAAPQYTLRGICRQIRMDGLTARVDVATKLAGHEKVPPMVEAELSAESYTGIELELWKNVVHVAVSDEAQKRAAHDILGLHASDAARDLARMENKQIAEELATATDLPGTDWGPSTT